MATPHPGSWEIALTQAHCELNTIDAPMHAAVFYNASRNIWKILYFSFGDPNAQYPFRAFIWDPLFPTAVSGPLSIPAKVRLMELIRGM